jgi:hypothetical protein
MRRVDGPRSDGLTAHAAATHRRRATKSVKQRLLAELRRELAAADEGHRSWCLIHATRAGAYCNCSLEQRRYSRPVLELYIRELERRGSGPLPSHLRRLAASRGIV